MLQGKAFALSCCYWSELQGLIVLTVPWPCETGPFPGTAGRPSATPLQTHSLQCRYMQGHTLSTLLSCSRPAAVMMQALNKYLITVIKTALTGTVLNNYIGDNISPKLEL